MKLDYIEILSRYSTAYIFEYDEDSNGIVTFDKNGSILNAYQIEQLVNGLTNFKNFYSEDSLNIKRNRIYQEN